MRALMKGLTDAEFERRYGAEHQCLDALVAARRAAGMACPDCDNPRFYLCGHRVGCTWCNRRWSVTAGTVMAHTKLPLRSWFRAMQLMSSTKQGISAVELGRRPGRYPSAWYLHKRLRHAMTERESHYLLGSAPADGSLGPVVEADDVYLGGERSDQGTGPGGKTMVIVAAERHATGRMGHIAMAIVDGFMTAAVQAFGDAKIAPAARVHTMA
jgi:transposase-like protein